MQSRFHLDPFQGSSIFIFCNKKRDALKVLRYDRNGFILASKKLVEEHAVPVVEDRGRCKIDHSTTGRLAVDRIVHRTEKTFEMCEYRQEAAGTKVKKYKEKPPKKSR